MHTSTLHITSAQGIATLPKFTCPMLQSYGSLPPQKLFGTLKGKNFDFWANMGPCQKSSDLGFVGRLNYMGHAPCHDDPNAHHRHEPSHLAWLALFAPSSTTPGKGVVGPGCEGCEPFSFNYRGSGDKAFNATNDI